MCEVYELSDHDKQHALSEMPDVALDDDARIFGVIFEPWEMAWLERSGLDIGRWIAAAIDDRFKAHGQNFPTKDAPPQCDLCLEEWGAHNRGLKPYIYDITGGLGVKTWAVEQRLYLHAECASEVREIFDPERTSKDQVAHKLEVADRLMANLASRLGIDEG